MFFFRSVSSMRAHQHLTLPFTRGYRGNAMNRPTVFFTKHHEYVKRASKTTYYVGITQFAADALGDIVYVDMTLEPGDTVVEGETYGQIESVKSSSDLIMPLDSTIVSVNHTALEDFEQLSTSPEETWICEVELANHHKIVSLMTDDEYENYKDENRS